MINKIIQQRSSPIDCIKSYFGERALARRLERLEHHFGGMHTVEVDYVGSHIRESMPGGVARQSIRSRGGDRMRVKKVFGGGNVKNQYARTYASLLWPIISCKKQMTICEIGILKGSGLALWNNLFPNSRLIGLDIDTKNFFSNFETLKALGAFRNSLLNTEERVGECDLNIFSFDSWNKKASELTLIKYFGEKVGIDFCVDDGDHQSIPQINNLELILPYLSNNFLYLIEDIKPNMSAPLVEALRGRFETQKR